MAICEECHNSIHFGRSQAVGLEEQASTYLQKINKWSEEETKNHIDNSFKEWIGRNRLHYKLDLSYLIDRNLISKRKIHLDWLNRPPRVRDRLDALSWSKTLLELPYAVILDTETTGLIEGLEKNPNAEVIELAILSAKGRTLYNRRFRPIYEIPNHVIGIHGITNDAVKKSSTFAQEFENIQKILHGKIVVAYNSRFDQKVIANTCKLHNLATLDNLSWECAMWAYKGYMESPRFLKLPHGMHSALADCKATLNMIKKMAKGEPV
jgi:DNA polymerase-3 subunit epsilon